MAYVISDDCIACGTCIDECAVGAISEGEKYSIDPEVCVECGTCADVCPSGAISLAEKIHVATRNVPQTPETRLCQTTKRPNTASFL